MTVLSACQSAALRLLGQRPATIFSSLGTFEMELAELATETAVAISKAHDWQKLTKLCTCEGDGVTAAFDLPPDYDRMTKDGNLHSKTFAAGLFRRAKNLDEWLFMKDQLSTGTPGNWIILGGQMQVFPAMATGETARFYYISNEVASGGKAAFSSDEDAPLLSGRLITLGLIWRWRAQKRMEYAEDLQNFELALSDEIARDKGARILAVGHRRLPADVSTPYPGVLGG